MTGLSLLLLGASLSGSPGDGIVCNSRHVPVPVRKGVYVLEVQTACFPVADAEKDQLEKLKLACDLLLTAYGRDEGQRRCQELIARTEVEP